MENFEIVKKYTPTYLHAFHHSKLENRICLPIPNLSLKWNSVKTTKRATSPIDDESHFCALTGHFAEKTIHDARQQTFCLNAIFPILDLFV